MTIKELIIFESSLTFLVQLMIVSESSCKSHGHLGASCSNIGRIRTKENIAVGTLLIGATPKPLGAIWSYSNLSLTPLVRFTDRIRIRNPQPFEYRVKIMFIICCLPFSFCCFNITNKIAWFSSPAQLLNNTAARVIQAGGSRIQRYELLRYDDH